MGSADIALYGVTQFHRLVKLVSHDNGSLSHFVVV